jgi:ABC-type nitrate/sulfonate/bicarbonate transport system substrate-binding protein
VKIAACFAAVLMFVWGPRPAAADDTLTFVLGSVPTLMDTLNLVAQQAGFYSDEHLIIQRVTVKGGAEALDSCASGATDICPMAVEALFTGYEQGIHAQFFLARAALYTYVLAVPVDSPIKSLTDFKGKSIGVHIVSPTPLAGQAAVTSMLANVGLKDSDYTFVTIGFNDDALDAVRGRNAWTARRFPPTNSSRFRSRGCGCARSTTRCSRTS